MKKVLVVIDMQNDFITGSLGSEEAIKIVPNVKERVEEYKKNGDIIICTRDTHNEGYLKSQEGQKLPIIHCVKDSFGWEIEGGIKSLLPIQCKIFDKGQFSSLELANYLKKINDEQGISEIEIVGLVTSICVIANAITIKGFLPEVKITVPKNCTASVSEEDYNAAILVMKMCQIEVI